MIRVFWKGNQISQYVGSITWSGTDTQVSRTVEFGLHYTPYDKGVELPDVKLGDVLTLYEGKKMLFYGKIVSRERKSEAGFLQYTAQDYMMHLLRSSGTYKFENKKAEHVAQMVCADAGVAVEKLAATKANLDKLFFLNRPFYEIVMAAYTQAARQDGKKYMPTMVGRKFAVVEKGTMIPGLTLNQGEVILDSTYTESLTSMVNQVAIYDSGNQKIGEVSRSDWVKAYGLYQNSIRVDTGDGKTEAENALTGAEKTASLNCLGDVRCTSGKGLVIRDNLSGMKGKFWIKSDSHTWAEDGTYTMALELEFQNLMETFEPDEEEQEQEYGENSVAGNRVLNGQKVRAKFTAYFPDNSPMEGGFLDALGNRLDPSKNTMAAPPSVPFHTQIQMLETGTSRDGQEYEVLDRGGAIQIEAGNVYHFDVLMSSATECNAWGVKMGYAIIGNGTGYTMTGGTGGGNSIAEQILNVARQYIGVKDGGNNQTIFGEHYGWNGVAWCCIFCWDVFRMAGYSHLFMDGAKCAHCFTLMDWYAARGKTGPAPKSGALAIFWGAGNQGHIGIVETVQSSTSFSCIEGNAGSSADGVYRIQRSNPSAVRTFCYPF